jgi:hypothetical protein
LEQSSREAGSIGWSLTDSDGVLHGVVEHGGIADMGFDRPAANDPAGVLLRRRLEANWTINAHLRHLVFARQATIDASGAAPIGSWRDLQQVDE